MEEELITFVNLALDDLYKHESYLFKNDCSERNLVFHFGRYFINALSNSTYLKKCNVDYEYNRDILSEKEYKEIEYEGKKHKIYPDMLLHERGTNNNNILVMEFKKWANNRTTSDYRKLRILTDQKLHFRYRLGLSIQFGKTRKNVIIRKYIDGKRKNE